MYLKRGKTAKIISLALSFIIAAGAVIFNAPRANLLAAGATYYVSPDGDDAGSGSISDPFKTIAKAAGLMGPGDICVLREGRYYETVVPRSGAEGMPITFTVYGGETATVSGADRVTGWTPVDSAELPSGADNVYKASVHLALGDGDIDDFLETLNDNDKRLWEYGSEFQIFRGGEMMYEARYPNLNPGATFANFTPGTTTGGNYITGTPSSVRTGLYINPDSGLKNLPGANDPGFLDGAWLWGVYGSRWCALTRPIVKYDPANGANGRIEASPCSTRQYPQGSGSYTPGSGQYYYVFGALGLLDADGEWWYDKQNKELYIVSETDPNDLIIEAKQRRTAFDLSGCSYVNIVGVNVLASTVLTDAASSNILLKNMKCEYVGYNSKTGLEIQGIDDNAAQDNQGILLKGSFITVDSCEMAYSSGPVLNVQGSDNTVVNCYVHDGNSMGCYAGHTKLSGRRQLITHNTFSDSGRDVVSFRLLSESVVQYNDIFNAGYLTRDLGMMYAANSDGQNTLIHHNVLHDNFAVGVNSGLYPDEMTQNYIMYGNIMYNAGRGATANATGGAMVHSNQASLYNLIYNNTTYNRSYYSGTYSFGAGYYTNVGRQVINNIFYDGFEITNSASTVFKNNLLEGSADSIYANAAGRDFSLKAGSAAIGAGKPLSGVTAPGLETPSVGALEFGEPMFDYGHDFNSPPDLALIRANLPSVLDFEYRNLVKNGGFEFGTTEGWSGDGDVVYGNAWHLNNANAAAGFYAGRLAPGETLTQTVGSLLPDSTYQFSLSIRKDGNLSQEAKILVKDAATGKTLAAWDLASAQMPTTWNLTGATAGRLAMSFTTESGPASVIISIENAGASGNLLIDDVGLAKVMADNAVVIALNVDGCDADFSAASIELTMTTAAANFPRTKLFAGADGTVELFPPAANTNWSWTLAYPGTPGASGTATINSANPASFVINAGSLETISDITFDVTPATASIDVYGPDGDFIAPDPENALRYGGLKAGVYTYAVAEENYYDNAGEFTMPADSGGVLVVELELMPVYATVTFDTNGGTGDAIEPVTVIVGETIELPEEPSREPDAAFTYVFAGWFTEDGVVFTCLTPVMEDTALYASWTAVPIPYVVSVSVAAEINKGGGNLNTLNFIVTEIYSDGDANKLSGTFSILNNETARFFVGKYEIYAETSGGKLSSYGLIGRPDGGLTVRASASVDKKTGSTNELTVTVCEIDSGGEVIGAYSATFTVMNNASGVYNVDKYLIYVAVSGNVKVDQCYVVE